MNPKSSALIAIDEIIDLSFLPKPLLSLQVFAKGKK
jgi:hypothetical protein